MKRYVMCVGTWPENNYADFVVFEIDDDETDESAIARAQVAYGDDREFYITDDPECE